MRSFRYVYITSGRSTNADILQVYHQWCSYAMFVLGLIHTFPFIIYHIQQGDMVSEWKTDLTYWTGVATLIPQAWLTFMSFPSIR